MVDVGVDLLGGVETLDDVRQQLEGKLSWPFEVKPVSTLLVRVVVESPPDVSEEEVKRQVDDIIASADDAKSPDDGEAGHVGETARTYGKGSSKRRGS